MGEKKGKRGLMKKIIITFFTIFTLFGCANDACDESIPKNTKPVKVEIISKFTETNISNWVFKDNNSIVNCSPSWGITNSYNEAMTLYAKNILNNNVSNVTNGYIQICNGRVNNPTTFYNFLKIYIVDADNKQALYQVNFGFPESYDYIIGYENQLINQALTFFKNDPTASFVGNFYVELE